MNTSISIVVGSLAIGTGISLCSYIYNKYTTLTDYADRFDKINQIYNIYLTKNNKKLSESKLVLEALQKYMIVSNETQEVPEATIDLKQEETIKKINSNPNVPDSIKYLVNQVYETSEDDLLFEKFMEDKINNSGTIYY